MAGPLALEPSRCVFILVDVINAVAKGQAPPLYPSPRAGLGGAKLQEADRPLPLCGHPADIRYHPP